MSDAETIAILKIFLCGFLGSGAVEVVTLFQVYQSFDSVKPKQHVLPARYSKVGFWVVRFLLAVIAGGLAVAYKIDNPILAINVGAATPLIIQALATGFRVAPTPPDANEIDLAVKPARSNARPALNSEELQKSNVISKQK